MPRKASKRRNETESDCNWGRLLGTLLGSKGLFRKTINLGSAHCKSTYKRSKYIKPISHDFWVMSGETARNVSVPFGSHLVDYKI